MVLPSKFVGNHKSFFVFCSKNVGIKKKSSKYILKSSITPRTSRKQFERSLSSFNLRKSRSCTNFDGDSDADSNTYRNYLTVHVSNSRAKKCFQGWLCFFLRTFRACLTFLA